jgi:hypothetical protein
MSKLTKIKVVQVGNVSKGEGYFHAFVEDSHDSYGNAETVAEAIGQLVWEIRNKYRITLPFYS